ncbi:NUDIX hydrolase [Ktedonosporobacter rubrisoli]|uniref:NUDIX hydrolase n=1 Tax=Ktedonosporobacter rubrisoli TaxID=2509675 RepID=UPI0013EE5EC9|nr:NUDIX hydrolase [Ktedonosporobacter rubrisoli]
MVVQPRLASTVMLLRDSMQGSEQNIEVFMVRRVVQSEFMPDLYVFPGGSVAADDRSAEQTEDICLSPSSVDPEQLTALGTGIRAAALRELFEEANVLLAYRDRKMLAVDREASARFAGYRQAFNERRGSLVELAYAEKLTLATDRLAYFAHWITPEGMPKRYDTYFFLAVAPEEQEAIYDQLETSDGVWIQPAQALQRFERREFPVAFPTFHQLRDLAAFHNTQEALRAAAQREVPVHEPLLSRQADKLFVYLPEEPERLWQI